MSQTSLDELEFAILLIQLRDGDNRTLLDQIAKDLFAATGKKPTLAYQE